MKTQPPNIPLAYKSLADLPDVLKAYLTTRDRSQRPDIEKTLLNHPSPALNQWLRNQEAISHAAWDGRFAGGVELIPTGSRPNTPQLREARASLWNVYTSGDGRFMGSDYDDPRLLKGRFAGQHCTPTYAVANHAPNEAWIAQEGIAPFTKLSSTADTVFWDIDYEVIATAIRAAHTVQAGRDLLCYDQGLKNWFQPDADQEQWRKKSAALFASVKATLGDRRLGCNADFRAERLSPEIPPLMPLMDYCDWFLFERFQWRVKSEFEAASVSADFAKAFKQQLVFCFELPGIAQGNVTDWFPLIAYLMIANDDTRMAITEPLGVRQFLSAHYIEAVFGNLGAPADDYTQVKPGVYHREFEHAYLRLDATAADPRQWKGEILA